MLNEKFIGTPDKVLGKCKNSWLNFVLSVCLLVGDFEKGDIPFKWEPITASPCAKNFAIAKFHNGAKNCISISFHFSKLNPHHEIGLLV